MVKRAQGARISILTATLDEGRRFTCQSPMDLTVSVRLTLFADDPVGART